MIEHIQSYLTTRDYISTLTSGKIFRTRRVKTILKDRYLHHHLTARARVFYGSFKNGKTPLPGDIRNGDMMIDIENDFEWGWHGIWNDSKVEFDTFSSRLSIPSSIEITDTKFSPLYWNDVNRVFFICHFTISALICRKIARNIRYGKIEGILEKTYYSRTKIGPQEYTFLENPRGRGYEFNVVTHQWEQVGPPTIKPRSRNFTSNILHRKFTIHYSSKPEDAYKRFWIYVDIPSTHDRN